MVSGPVEDGDVEEAESGPVVVEMVPEAGVEEGEGEEEGERGHQRKIF